MSSRLDEALKMLVHDPAPFAITDLKERIYEAKADENIFIRHIGELTEYYLRMKAADELTTDEFKVLMEDLLDLNVLKYRSLSSELRLRIEMLTENLSGLILEKLIPHLGETAYGGG